MWSLITSNAIRSKVSRIRKFLPDALKNIIRFFAYKNERNKVFREVKIRKEQDQLIQKLYSRDTKRLIVFLVEGADWFTGLDSISGGILSIASIYEETRKLKHVHNAEVIMCTYPNSYLLLGFSQFDSEIKIFRYEQLESYFKNLQFLLLHSIEYRTPGFAQDRLKDNSFYSNISDFRFNILNQNVKLMPPPGSLEVLHKCCNNVTQTTAHKKYSSEEFKKKYGFPLHHLSVFGSPEKYTRKHYSEKRNLITISPDIHDIKSELIQKIKDQTDYDIIIIKDLKYQEYLKIIGESKFTITLGEGLDFYFTETVFSGGVAFTLRNRDFFTEEFKNVVGIYPSPDEMLLKIIHDMCELESEEKYQLWNNLQYQPCEKEYKYDEYKRNLELFYLGNYTIK